MKLSEKIALLDLKEAFQNRTKLTVFIDVDEAEKMLDSEGTFHPCEINGTRFFIALSKCKPAETLVQLQQAPRRPSECQESPKCLEGRELFRPEGAKPKRADVMGQSLLIAQTLLQRGTMTMAELVQGMKNSGFDAVRIKNYRRLVFKHFDNHPEYTVSGAGKAQTVTKNGPKLIAEKMAQDKEREKAEKLKAELDKLRTTENMQVKVE